MTRLPEPRPDPIAWPDPIDGLVVDLDGTLYRGDVPIPGALEAMRELDRAGVPLVFVTNNSTRSRRDVADKLAAMGYAIDESRVVNSSYATARHLAANFTVGDSVFVIGAPALKEDIERAGFTLAEGAADIVVVGLDVDFTYAKLRTAVHSIRSGAAFVLTNPDRLIPHGPELDPGAGSVAAAVVAATDDVTTPVVIGKPDPAMLRMALDIMNARPAHTVVVGDQLMTDVAGAKNAGMYAVLVQTGVPVGHEGGPEPDRVIASTSELGVLANR